MSLKRRSTLLLAGGKSSRMGVAKGLLNYAGIPWLVEQLRRLHDCGCTDVILVLGYLAEEYYKALPPLREGLDPRSKIDDLTLSVVINEQPHLGPFSSIVKGLESLRSFQYSSSIEQGLFILPIDVPCPRRSVWDELDCALDSSVRVALPVREGRGGHPVLLSYEFQEKLLRVPLDSTEARLDFQIQALEPRQLRRIHVSDPQIRMNLNTRERWQEFLTFFTILNRG